MSLIPIQRALISVSDKKGIEAFARALATQGIEILSTGGTAKLLREAGIQVRDVSDFTGFPELMEGRIKTLHPCIHGGILAKREEKHLSEARQHGIEMIDLVVVNLYPFEETIESLTTPEDATEESSQADAETKSERQITLLSNFEDEIIEQIDIGGPSMLRSAAKNFRYVTVVTDQEDYELVLQEIEQYKGTTLETRRSLASKAFKKTARYDEAISEYFQKNGGKPELLDLHYEKVLSLRYGENPHQKAAFFRDPNNLYPNVTNARIIQGKQLSYNNILDTDVALKIVQEFTAPTAVLIKHTNPCGVASHERIEEAFEKAYLADQVSAFGCVIALNRPCTLEVVQIIKKNTIFVEIIAAPSFSADALKALEKRKNLRVVETGELRINPADRDIKSVGGGILVQTADLARFSVQSSDILRTTQSDMTVSDMFASEAGLSSMVDGRDRKLINRIQASIKIVTKRKPTAQEMSDMFFAATVVKHVKSNAVVFAKDQVTTGIGAGQMSRVDSVFIASHKGGERVKGSVMASDAFFPFPDAVEEAHKAHIKAIIQPGGSIRDEEIIAKAEELDMAMIFTGVRSFKH